MKKSKTADLYNHLFNQMKTTNIFLLMAVMAIFFACNTKNKQAAAFLTAKDAVRLNQLIYKENTKETLLKYAPEYEVVFHPQAVDGNYAVVVKKKNTEQYALVIRGSVIEFSNEGFQNFFLQDFNIFTMKDWDYTDTVKKASISRGAYIGFQNLQQLKDVTTGLSLKEFIGKNIPAEASIIVTGHSLGGNLAYPLAGYLKKEIQPGKRIQLITFGAPAAGNAAFVQDLEEKFPDAERYAIDNDIAPMFPDLKAIGNISAKMGLDSVLHLGDIVGGDIGKNLNARNLLNIASEILDKTNILDESRKYVQSLKHLRPLAGKDTSFPDGNVSAEMLFNRAYQFHKVDMYATMLGGKPFE